MTDTDIRKNLGFFVLTAAAAILTPFLIQQWWGWLVGAGLLLLGFAILAWPSLRARVVARRERERQYDLPQEIRPDKITETPGIGTPTFTQGPRHGWRANCEYVGASYSFGRGVILSLHSDGNEIFPTFRSLIRGPNGYRAGGTQRLLDESGNDREGDSRHFPGEFQPKPSSDPPPPGTYEVEWFADTGDPADEKELFLARTSFRVTERGEYFCAVDSAKTEAMPRIATDDESAPSAALRINESGQPLASHYYPRLYRDELCADMPPNALIVRTVLGCPLPKSGGEISLRSATKRALRDALMNSPLEEWLRTQSLFCQAEQTEPWQSLGRYNDSRQSTLWWNAGIPPSNTVVLRGRCQVMVGTTSPLITVLLDVVADAGNSRSAAPQACGQLAPERLTLLLRASLRTCLESIGEAVLSPIAGPDWRPYGPAWLLGSGTAPLDNALDLSRFSRMIGAEQRTEYAMVAEAGFDLWSDADRRHVLRGCLERFLLDLQYEDFDDELDDLFE